MPRDGPRTVLVTEDDRFVRAFVADVLRSEGYDVLEARNPSEALALASRDPRAVALLITDLVMPELNGPQLAELLRSSNPAMKVLFISGYGAESIVTAGIGEITRHLLHKPVSPDELIRRVKEAMGEGAAP